MIRQLTVGKTDRKQKNAPKVPFVVRTVCVVLAVIPFEHSINT